MQATVGRAHSCKASGIIEILRNYASQNDYIIDSPGQANDGNPDFVGFLRDYDVFHVYVVPNAVHNSSGEAFREEDRKLSIHQKVPGMEVKATESAANVAMLKKIKICLMEFAPSTNLESAEVKALIDSWGVY